MQASCSPSMKPSRSSSAFNLRTPTKMEPTGLNANHLALVSGGCLSLGEQL
jgi:hypothetical protein